MAQPMNDLQELFENNRRWSSERIAADPEFFERLSLQQAPRYLWIGCSDSRVPANQIIGLDPGQVFVHRNVANVVVHTDFNCLAVLQYAVEMLQVQHIIVCGHYGCGGVQAAMSSQRFGLVDNWLRHIEDIYARHRQQLEALPSDEERLALLCELNVAEQVTNVCRTTIVQDAWRRGQELTVHGWIYSLQDGLLRDLGLSTTGPGQLSPIYRSEPSASEGPESG